VDCAQALSLISARLDGELPPGDGADLDAHLAACPACQAADEDFRLQDADLRRAFRPRREAAVRVAERVIGRLQATPGPTRSSSRWLPLVLSAAAGFLLAVAIFRPWRQPLPVVPLDGKGQGHAPPRPALQLALTTGAVEVLAPGEDTWQPLAGGDTVDVGCRVRTPPTVRCEFCCPSDNTEVRLNGDTELHVRSDRQLDLSRGQILAKVARTAVPLEVGVASATVTALGTQFDLWTQPQGTRLAVLDGKTRVRGQGTDTVVETGELATIVNGRVTERRQSEDLLRATDWVRELLVLKGGKNDELTLRLTERVNDILAQIGNEKASGAFTDEQIRSLGYHCVVPLTRFLESKRSHEPGQEHRRVRAARLIADLAQPWHIPDLIDLLGDDDAQVRFHAARGLVRLVPEQEPLTPEGWRDSSKVTCARAMKDWRAWWDRSKDRYPRMP
jgi:ferric-dicitrate binding protein FerR (iron transport regulator)